MADEEERDRQWLHRPWTANNQVVEEEVAYPLWKVRSSRKRGDPETKRGGWMAKDAQNDDSDSDSDNDSDSSSEMDLEEKSAGASRAESRMEEDTSLVLKYAQLQEDMDVIVAHLEEMTRQREAVDHQNADLMRQAEDHAAATAIMQTQLDSLQVENAALKNQNALLAIECAEMQNKAATAMETHEELLLALRTEQAKSQDAVAASVHLARERNSLVRSVEDAQRALAAAEDEIARLKRLCTHLEKEKKDLMVMQTATLAHENAFQKDQAAMKQEAIERMRADLLNLEFEYRTLLVDKERLEAQVAKLEQKLQTKPLFERRYDTIALTDDTTKTRSAKPSHDPDHGRTRALLDDGRAFDNILDLPNYVSERSNSTTAESESTDPSPYAAIPRSLQVPVSTFGKAVQSAKRRIFSPTSSSSSSSSVLPQ
ncbi:TPA: hypothetical protein N0F65_000843 [Lagenidium giganteum]|uniref:Uncharacterized protein n=1 Tax=Lagenidium giganteum TaxID=4803 RepID=A0AAV2YZQ8_9STRA|nr:TPA: hypothetical protein N0F65_000843 [Lagenidium giganteum]